MYEPEDNPFCVLLSRLDSNGTVVDHVTIHSHSRDISHLSSDRSRLGPSETQRVSSDADSEAIGTDDEDMFERRSEATVLRRAARARIVHHRRMGRQADTTFGEYATFSPLIRWEPHGHTRDGLPYTATHTDVAQRTAEYADTTRCINTPVSVMAVPLNQAELSRIKKVLLHTPPPQRVLLSITDPDERQRPIQILAGDRLDPRAPIDTAFDALVGPRRMSTPRLVTLVISTAPHTVWRPRSTRVGDTPRQTAHLPLLQDTYTSPIL